MAATDSNGSTRDATTMQDTRRKESVASKLAVTACSLLGLSGAHIANAQEAPPVWDINTSLLYYGESDDRVQDLSLTIYGKRRFSDERNLSLSLTVDSLTGASASGAIALDTPQTFTSPSGNAVYTTEAGVTPLDDTFLDTRVAVTAGWSQPLGENYLFGAGFSGSKEYDYLHLGANFSLARNFNKNNTTVSAGVAFAADTRDPVGGAPVGLAQMGLVGELDTRVASDQDKDIVDLLLGVSQVINKNLIVQVNYSYSDSSGYLNDPYKIISVVDGVTGDTIPVTTTGVGPSHLYRFESRPDSRTKHSLFGQMKYYRNGKVLDASYRFMTDDWEIDSHTLDVRYRIPFNQFYLEPHVRLYSQTAADFYQSSLIDEVALPQFASSDYRLGEFDAFTVGAKVGGKRTSGNQWSVRLEYYSQQGNIPGDQIIGNQANRVQYPDLDAIIAQFSYKFGL